MPSSGRVHDRDLLDALESIGPERYDGIAWRCAHASRNPLAASIARGRWHPPGTFEALYTSLEADSALAEVHHHLSRAPVFSSSHVKLHRLRIGVERVLRLIDRPALEIDLSKSS
jgi:RES domain-containing protein